MENDSARAGRSQLHIGGIATKSHCDFHKKATITPDASERQEAGTTKRLDQIDRRMARMDRDLGIAVETLAVFVRFWLTTNPPLPEPAQAAARSKAVERY